MSSVNITSLLRAGGVDAEGAVDIRPTMSGVETNPKNDWMYLGLRTLRDVAREKKDDIHSVAGIGSGNGIMEIAMVHTLPCLKRLFVTDILADILPTIRSNIENNIGKSHRGTHMQYIAGADCDPLPESVDLIYGNLPLIMVDAHSLQKDRATTTLTDAKRYEHLGTHDDPLARWSLLSQLGFLTSAMRKLNPGGSIITLLGGRVPTDVIAKVFSRAGLRYRERYCAFKKQSDPEFLREYAEHEVRTKRQFFFYDFQQAESIIRHEYGIDMPDILPVSGDTLRSLIHPARLTAVQAYERAQRGNLIGHIAFAFEAFR